MWNKTKKKGACTVLNDINDKKIDCNFRLIIDIHLAERANRLQFLSRSSISTAKATRAHCFVQFMVRYFGIFHSLTLVTQRSTGSSSFAVYLISTQAIGNFITVQNVIQIINTACHLCAEPIAVFGSSGHRGGAKANRRKAICCRTGPGNIWRGYRRRQCLCEILCAMVSESQTKKEVQKPLTNFAKSALLFEGLLRAGKRVKNRNKMQPRNL